MPAAITQVRPGSEGEADYRRLQKINRLLSAMTHQALKAAKAAEKRNEVEKQEGLRRIVSLAQQAKEATGI